MPHRFLITAALAAPLLWAPDARAESDSQLWTEAGISADLGKQTEISLTGQLRFDQQISRVAGVLPELSIERDLARWLELGAGYRFEYERNGDGDMVIRHRLVAEGGVQVEPGALKLGYRLRFQEQIRAGGALRHTVRNRLGLDVRRLKPFVPGGSVELFHGVGGGDPATLKKIRVTLGTEYDLGKQELGFFYRLELPHDDPMDPVLHILMLELASSL